MDDLLAIVTQSRTQAQPTMRPAPSELAAAPRAPPNSPVPELEAVSDNATIVDTAGPSNQASRREEPAQVQHEQPADSSDESNRTIIDVCTSLLNLATTQPEDRANWIRTLRTDAAWLLQLARFIEKQQRDEHAANEQQERRVKGRSNEMENAEDRTQGSEKGKETADEDAGKGKGKGEENTKEEAQETDGLGKGKPKATDRHPPERRARDCPRYVWRPADYGGDFSVKPTYEERPREVYFGTVEDDAATCQPHMY